MSEQKKTILVFTDWYYPAFRAGGPVRSVYNFVNLLRNDFNIRIVCRDRDLGMSEPFSGIIPNIWTKLDSCEVMYLDQKGASLNNIKQIVYSNKDNILYINGIFSLKYSILPLIFSVLKGRKSTFISVRGMLHASALSVKAFKKQLFLAFARGFGLYASVTLLASDQKEEVEISRSLGRRVKIKILPNIPENPDSIHSDVLKIRKNVVTSFLYLGRISPEKNAMAVLKAFRSIKDNCNLTFCGSWPDGSYQNECRALIDALPENINFRYAGELPHAEVSDLLGKSDVMLLPSLGENFGHAIYESLMHSVPVIIGNNTPWKFSQIEDGGIMLEPEDIPAIIEAINRFIRMDDALYKTVAIGAQSKAQQYFESNNFREQYLKTFS